MKRRPALTTLFSLVLCAIIALCWGNTAYILLKAKLAQYLISNAWNQSLATGEKIKPWPWADTWPVARLISTSTHTQLFVLEGASGTSLAFGPGRVLPTYANLTTIIAGHRDTHFAFLKKIKPGDLFILEDSSGKRKTYRTEKTQVVDTTQGQWHYDPSQDEIHLITCYPFNATLPGGPLRYIVVAKPIDNIPSSNIPIANKTITNKPI